MPVYEFECDNCGFIWDRLYGTVPKEDLIQVVEVCTNCEFRASHKKIMSPNTFHLKGGKVSWGEGKYSSASEKGDDVVSVTEPDGPIKR